ncbi:MAG: aldehyde dehydrogenase family protein [Porticoccaceae bacterium]|nr:aldehyde dehydrogenase family protein [Porticoccaceae bacterium]
MTSHYPLMIPGTSETAEPLSVTSPYSGEQIATVARADEQQVELALSTAHSLFRDRSQWLPLTTRLQILEATAALMAQQFDTLAEGAAREGGKPLVDSRVEVERAIEGIKLCEEHISQHVGDVVPMPEPERMAFTQKEPIGVVVAVSAFNHPLNLIVHQVGAAVAAGCPVIVKPAQHTPLSCLRFVELLRQAGLPPQWCQVVLPTSTELSTKLVCDQRVGFFSFIGSARVGWMLRSKLAPGTRCALEHGGVAPVIVDASADLGKVIPALLKGGFYHAGQVCVSVQRVYVPNSLLQKVAEQLAKGASRLTVGDPLNAATDVGPLITAGEVDRIHQWVQEAQQQGARLKAGGEKLGNNCYAPTLLVNPPDDTQISTREVFGPVVCLYGYDRVGEAIDRANSLEVAFQAAVFSQDIDRAINISQRLDASAVMINDHSAFRHDGMPFAGLRQSGLGVGGIGHTIDEMQIDKMMVMRVTPQ